MGNFRLLSALAGALLAMASVAPRADADCGNEKRSAACRAAYQSIEGNSLEATTLVQTTGFTVTAKQLTDAGCDRFGGALVTDQYVKFNNHAGSSAQKLHYKSDNPSTFNCWVESPSSGTVSSTETECIPQPATMSCNLPATTSILGDQVAATCTVTPAVCSEQPQDLTVVATLGNGEQLTALEAVADEDGVTTYTFSHQPQAAGTYDIVFTCPAVTTMVSFAVTVEPDCHSNTNLIDVNGHPFEYEEGQTIIVRWVAACTADLAVGPVYFQTEDARSHFETAKYVPQPFSCQDGAEPPADRVDIDTPGQSINPKWEDKAQRWHLNWKTVKGWATECRLLEVTLGLSPDEAQFDKQSVVLDRCVCFKAKPRGSKGGKSRRLL